MYTTSHKILVLLIICVFVGSYDTIVGAKDIKFGSLAALAKDKAKDTTENDSATYAKELKGFKQKKGMFVVHQDKKNNVYFEIPDSAFGHTYVLVNRISSISNTQEYVAGQMCTTPLLVRFTHDYNNVYMQKVMSDAEVDSADVIKPAFERDFKNPVLKGFKIKARTKNSYVIDVTSFFGENERLISPLRPDNPLQKLLGSKSNLKGTFNSSASCIDEVKAFPKNIQIKSTLSYNITLTDQPYTVQLTRSLVQLPDTMMPRRLQDNRVGYFSSYKRLFTSKADNVEEYNIIHRWNIQPRPEDMQKYLAGELVEPQKKIVYYIDSAFPEKWAKAVKEGVEYWNKAFEAAGFKNVVEARMYPADDPTFDPDDARYSCIRYCVTTTANAMGPSYVDPRTGEILSADVIWYHNIISLLHNWKFVQTAAVDPRVRKNVFDDATMYEAITYAAAHEVGHTLGLMHNMGASFAFPLDKLRDPAFTQKYGTTPSIMDYARNNYVAQPGDYERGVRLTPPSLGVYDIYAINWGYRIIPDAKTMFDEKATLDKWIREKAGDPMYEFGAQQMLGLVDPTDQTEDLSNDQIKAGTMSISNLKIIMQNLETWTEKKDENYDNVVEMYNAVLQQYNRHIGHVMPYIGGIIYKEVRQGHDDGYAQNYIPKAKTKEAMAWLLNQARTSDWLDKKNIVDKMAEVNTWRKKMNKNIVSCLLNSRGMRGIKDGYSRDPATGYMLTDYVNDAYNGIFKAAITGQKLNDTERDLQSAAIDVFMRGAGLEKAAAKTETSALTDYYTYLHDIQSEDMMCSSPEKEDDCNFMRIVLNLPTMPAEEYQPIMLSCLNKVLTLYRSRRASGDQASRAFYDYEIAKITRYLKGNQ